MERVRLAPLLSPSAARLLELVGEKDHGLQEVIQIVECDAVLTARVLKVINAPVFRMREPVTTVGRAVTYLGEKMVIGVALAGSAEQIYANPLLGYEGKPGDLWQHSLRTALAARELARHSQRPTVPDLAFTAGILHDIGKAILSEFLYGLSPEAIRRIDEGQSYEFLQAEEELVGANHCEVGAELAEHWNLPEPHRAVIAFHHQPSLAPEDHRDLVYVVHLGDIVAMMGGAGTGADAMTYRLDRDWPQYVKIDRQTLDGLMVDVMVEFEKTESLLFGDRKVET